jgi:lipoprotein signal peptidase
MNLRTLSKLKVPFFLLIIGIDEGFRTYLRRESFLADFSLFRLELHWNEGFFTGTGSELSPLVNQVFLSSVSLLIVALLSLIGFLYRKDRIQWLSTGLWSLGFGLMVNVGDRIFFGRVTDWIILKAGIFQNYAFNLADLLIALGIFILSLLLIFRSERFWQNSQVRDKILIEKKFQFGMGSFLVLATAAVGVGMTFTTIILFRLFLIAPTDSIRWYGIVFFGVLTLWLGIGWLIGMVYSRNLFGPVLALENLIERALAGKSTERDRKFKLRKVDSFQRLGPLGQEVVAKSLSKNSD